MNSGAYGCNHNLLACSHISRAANYTKGFYAAYIQFGEVQVVAVGVVGTFEHVTYHQAFKPADSARALRMQACTSLCAKAKN